MKITPRPMVMLIDDNEIDNYINKKFIEDSGISKDILIMGTAEKALKYLRQNSDLEKIPDIILLDINLPAVNGHDFLQEFKKLPQKFIEKCKIVVLSSSDKDEDIAEMGNNILVKNYFLKPLSDDALEQIREILK